MKTENVIAFLYSSGSDLDCSIDHEFVTEPNAGCRILVIDANAYLARQN